MPCAARRGFGNDVTRLIPSAESISENARDIAKARGRNGEGLARANALDCHNVIDIAIHATLGKVVGEMEFDVFHGEDILG